jgi:hypothetical protein
MRVAPWTVLRDGPGGRRAGSPGRPRTYCLATLLLVPVVATACQSHPIPPPSHFPSEQQALARNAIARKMGVADGQLRVSAHDDETFDLRGYVVRYWPPASDPSEYPIVIGKDDPAVGTAVVGGTVLGQLPRDATWQAVKDCCDVDALRLEGRGWVASYGFRAENVEDGFAPRVPDTGGDDRFLLQGCYMRYIRDDAVENDDVMSGTIRDCLFDGVSRFLSERPSEGTDVANPTSVVSIDHVLVHMQPMPNDRSSDGMGCGSIFKWSTVSGSVVMSHSIIYVEEPSQTNVGADAFPPGTYRDVTLVLGPGYTGPYRVPLPAGVTVTRDVSVWDAAQDAWLAAHRDVVSTGSTTSG